MKITLPPSGNGSSGDDSVLIIVVIISIVFVCSVCGVGLFYFVYLPWKRKRAVEGDGERNKHRNGHKNRKSAPIYERQHLIGRKGEVALVNIEREAEEKREENRENTKQALNKLENVKTENIFNVKKAGN